jgi:hypothetical protein
LGADLLPPQADEHAASNEGSAAVIGANLTAEAGGLQLVSEQRGCAESWYASVVVIIA